MVAVATLELQSFAVFAPLAGIAEDVGTEIVLHGGAAFRAALFAAYQDQLDFDLFDLSPFNSDIDLEHDGLPEKTAEIRRLIDKRIPFASWCRWSINDGERAALARAQREASTDVPLRRIRFATNDAPSIPHQALLDLGHRRISFARNPRFGQSESETRPDLELFGLMMALNSWDEAEEIAGDAIGFDREAAHAWLDEGLDAKSLPLLERPGLAARFWHLLSLRLARRGLDEFNAKLIRIGAPILDKFDLSLAQLRDSNRAISVSKITSTARFRVPELTPPIITGAAAAFLFGDIIRDAATRAGIAPDSLPRDPLDLIDSSLELVGIVPDLTVLPYGSGKDGDDAEDDAFLSGAEEEFVQFVWEIQPGDRVDPHALTGQILALGAADLGASSALPVVGGIFDGSRAWLRARLDDLIERGAEGGPVDAVLLILQARSDDEAELENDPSRSRPNAAGEYFQGTEHAPAPRYAGAVTAESVRHAGEASA